MKRIILVSGFLGSGKTTFITKLIQYLYEKDLKVALIVNELGEIGIDNQYLTQLGYNVWELFGGCICCTLATNLETTLKELEDNYQPDIILVEPSGAADPKSIYDSLTNLEGSKNKVFNFLILDPTRIDMFVEILSPLLHSSLKSSDAVLINKIDLASTEELDQCKDVISSTKKDIPVFMLNFHDDVFPNDFKDFVNQLI